MLEYEVSTSDPLIWQMKKPSLMELINFSKVREIVNAEVWIRLQALGFSLYTCPSSCITVLQYFSKIYDKCIHGKLWEQR